MLTVVLLISNSLSMPQTQAILEEKCKLKETTIFISLRKLISKAGNFYHVRIGCKQEQQCLGRTAPIMEILTLGCYIPLTAACQG